MIRHIQPRLRLADLAGWIGASEVGVILFDTDHDGARIFAGHVIKEWPSTQPQPTCRIYTYPSAFTMDDERQLWFDSLGAVRDDPSARLHFSRRERIYRTLKEKTRLTAAEGAPGAPPSSEEVLDYLLAIHTPWWKRTLDLILAGTALVVLSPLLLSIALLIRLTSKGPILFCQERVGYMGRVFNCMKFRTMHVNAGNHMHRDYVQQLIRSEIAMSKLDGHRDTRVYGFGRFLRVTSLDELPQLFNVLRGEMSLIGPRPCIPYEYERYQPWHRHRVDALPGLTGLWQVSGKNKTTFAQMIRLDRTYARKESFPLDARIIMRTLPVLIGQFRDDLKNRWLDGRVSLKTILRSPPMARKRLSPDEASL